MKKIISIICAAVIATSLPLVCFADETTHDTVSKCLQPSAPSAEQIENFSLLTDKAGRAVAEFSDPTLIHCFYSIKNDDTFTKQDVFSDYSGDFSKELDASFNEWLIPVIENGAVIGVYDINADDPWGIKDSYTPVKDGLGVGMVYSDAALDRIFPTDKYGTPTELKSAYMHYPVTAVFMYVKTTDEEYIVPFTDVKIGSYDDNDKYSYSVEFNKLCVYTANKWVERMKNAKLDKERHDLERADVDNSGAQYVDGSGNIETTTPKPTAAPALTEKPIALPAATQKPAMDVKRAAELDDDQPYPAQGFTFAPGGAGNAVIGSDGVLYTWGLNGTDRWGYPDTESSGDVFRADMYDCVAVAQGGSHTLMLKEDGTMWGVGFNDHRQLLNPDKLYIPEPMELMDNVKQIAAGFQTSFAVTNDGKLYGWGLNAEGELGNGKTTESVAEPQEIMSNVKLVSAGMTHTAAIKNDDSLWTWGDNSCGELGDGGGIYRTKPIKIMEDVAFVDLGDQFTLILKNDGSVWSCGRNMEGQLGDGTRKNTNTPVKIMDGAVAISAGAGIAAAIKADNSLWMWGYYGLGSIPVKNEISGRDDIELCVDTPEKVMDDVYAVYAGNYTVYALKTDGILWGWGAAYGVETDPQEAVFDYSGAYIPRKLTDGVMLPAWRMTATNEEIIDTTGRDVIDVKTGGGISVELNGKDVIFPDAQPYIDENGRTKIPIRAVAEALGCKVDWDGTERVATITKDNKVITIAIGNNNMQVGNDTVIMDTTAEIKDERTYIPVRFVGEALGMQVNWIE